MPEHDHRSAGDFSSWLRVTRRQPTGDDPAGDPPRAGDVPCGDCSACCTSSYFIHIQPHETEAIARIPREVLVAAPGLPQGHMVMGYDENGQCPMFVDEACSIYDDRPQTCRDYDCRIFAATGIELSDDEKAGVLAQTRRWTFDTYTDDDRARQTAVRASADYLRAHAHHLPAGSVPKNPTHLALLAIDVHEVFLVDDGSGHQRCLEPDLDVVADALETSMERSRSSDI